MTSGMPETVAGTHPGVTVVLPILAYDEAYSLYEPQQEMNSSNNKIGQL